jgi:hypothetical protein
VTALVGLARSGRQRSWWHAYRDRLLPTFVKLIGYEAEAFRIIAVSGLLIPGLLQTEEYANALAEGSNPVAIDEEEVEFTTKIRMRRQQELFANRQPSPHITSILDEGALRRIVGDPDITLRQLDHLIRMAERPDVEIGVVPFSAGAYPGMFGTFTILQFEDPVTDDVMYTDQLSGLLLFRDLPDETDQYWEALERIQAVTMSTQDTVALIRKVKEDLSNG